MAVMAVMAGCTSSGEAPVASGASGTSPATDAPTSASYAPAPCPDAPVLGSPQFDIGAAFTCGYLTVPENRSHPEGPTIRLLVATLPAASATPDPDPIVWMTGGPGSPMVADVNVAAGLGLNADRNVILFEQRGNYSAEPNLVSPRTAPSRRRR